LGNAPSQAKILSESHNSNLSVTRKVTTYGTETCGSSVFGSSSLDSISTSIGEIVNNLDYNVKG
jgi:hypothetical protein